MSENWKTYKLGDVIVSANTGLDAIKRAPIVEEDTGIKCLRIQDVSQVKEFQNWGFCTVSSGNYNKFSLKEGEIIIARTGNTIGVNMFIQKNVKSVFNNGLIRIRINRELCDPKYVYYNFRTNIFKAFIQSIAFGTSTQPNMQINSLLSFEFKIPPLPEQRIIASILSSIDDKIELNLQMNRTLEEMAMALYKHWFVDFGPFQEGEFVDSELGMIPKGWEVKSIGDFTNILDTKRVPLSSRERTNRKGPYPYYGASGVIDSIDDYKFDGEYVIVSEDGENLRSRNTPIAFSAAGQFWVNNHAHILQGKHEGINELIICHFAQLDMGPYLTGAVQPKLNQQNLLLIKIPIPLDKSIINDVFKELHSLSRMFISNTIENQTLTTLRDTLLPKLISGEVRVKEAAEILEEVL